MIQLTWIPEALQTLGGFYIVLALVSLAYALIKPKTAWNRGWAVAGVVVLFGGLPIGSYIAGSGERQQRKEQDARLAQAKARFEMRCKGAGEKIHRMVENVDGVVWMKWREPISNADNFADQYKLNDPYGQDCGGEDCIKSLLRVTKGGGLNPEGAKQYTAGYRFVETQRPREEQRYRYIGAMKLAESWTPEGVERLKREKGQDPPSFSYVFSQEWQPISEFTTRYGITWDDISTKEDRDYWIAGSSLKVIDLQTNEVIAERIGYVMDPGQGSQAGFRSPWGWAKTYGPKCPKESPSTLGFVSKVLQPNDQGK